jgi:serine/threonine protein kinase/tetratricopeptide (TPR) repeat protein
MTEAFEVPSAALLSPGGRIGPYRLIELLGQGGAAWVFRAVDETTGQVVALKTAHEASESRLASVRREIQALGRVRHAGVVNILDGGVHQGRPWYTMELLEGATLRQHMKGLTNVHVSRTTDLTESHPAAGTIDTALGQEDGVPLQSAGGRTAWRDLQPAPPSGGELAWVLSVIRRLCEPLAFIHGEGFVHRDLKPSNIFVRDNGTPVLMDFGLVWLVQEEGGRAVLSVDAARGGTIAYMAPEQARGERMDARGDLFALGCILYEAVTGRLAFPARTRLELVDAHERPPPVPSRITPGVAPELEAVIMRLLERNPRDRIGHADDLAAALGDLGADGPSARDQPKAKAYLYRPELVGRGALVDDLVQRLEQVRARRGGFGIVSGESGIGKTSFVSEVARRAGASGFRVVTSECIAVGLAAGRGVRQGGPLYPFARFLQAVADRCVAEGPAVAVKILGERAKILAVTEPSLRQLPGLEVYAEPAEVPGEAARRRLIDALAETVSAFVADRPTLVIIDDLQWADDLTLAFLGSLSERYFHESPVFFLGTYRLEESTTELDRIAAAPHVASFRLERLEPATIGNMSADMLGLRRVSDELVAFLGTESSGNPFFVAEYLRAAVDAGLLFRDGRGRWQQAGGPFAPEKLGLPHNLHALVTRRLESLKDQARRLAEVAGVLGRQVQIEVLGALALELGVATDEADFDEVLRHLMVRQVLEASGAGSVRFVHDKLREIGYEALDPERQRSLHAAAGALLERRHAEAGDLDRVAGMLAHHYERAADLEKALVYFDRAGEAAHGMHANQEAVRLLEKARSLEKRARVVTTPVLRARRERLLGLDALALGNVNEALARLTDAASLAGRPWPSTRVGVLLRGLWGLAHEVVRRCAPWLRTPRLRSGLERESLLEAARAYERLLVVNYFATGDMLAVMLAATVNMGLAERAGGASSERALGYASFAAMCSLLPFDAFARGYCRRALDDARASGDEVAESWVRMNVALVHMQAARWPEMEEQLEEVRAMALRIGFKRRWEEATTQFSTARFLSGRFADATALNADLSGAIERADPQSKCWAVVRDAELALLVGDVEAALAAAREGEAHCEQGLGFAEWIYALGPLALSHLRAGDLAAALEAADRCAGWMKKGSAPVFYNINAYAAVAEVYFAVREASRDPLERRRLAARARAAVKRLVLVGYAMPIAAPRAFFWRGIEALRLRQRRDLALRWFRQSLERARRLEMAYDEGMALAMLGEHGPDPGENARLLGEAGEILERIGASRERARVAALLAANVGAAPSDGGDGDRARRAN